MNKEFVILLHGLARTARSFNKMDKALQNAGYQVVNESYPSTRNDIHQLADDAIYSALEQATGASKIHFVTHSMGGILVRHFLSRHSIENLGNIVMLGPPNKGSEVVNILGNVPGFKLINGPAGQELGTSPTSTPNKIGAANFPVGIIAGDRSLNPILSTMISGKNDGKVSVASTMLEGMSDHLVLPVTHTFMMNNDVVIKETLHFLRHERFTKNQTSH